MCVCVCVCVFVSVSVCVMCVVYMHKYTHVCACVRACMRACTRACVCVCCCIYKPIHNPAVVIPENCNDSSVFHINLLLIFLLCIFTKKTKYLRKVLYITSRSFISKMQTKLCNNI